MKDIKFYPKICWGIAISVIVVGLGAVLYTTYKKDTIEGGCFEGDGSSPPKSSKNECCVKKDCCTQTDCYSSGCKDCKCDPCNCAKDCKCVDCKCDPCKCGCTPDCKCVDCKCDSNQE